MSLTPLSPMCFSLISFFLFLILSFDWDPPVEKLLTAARVIARAKGTDSDAADTDSLKGGEASCAQGERHGTPSSLSLSLLLAPAKPRVKEVKRDMVTAELFVLKRHRLYMKTTHHNKVTETVRSHLNC